MMSFRHGVLEHIKVKLLASPDSITHTFLGEFGARASKRYPLLNNHHNVQLTDDERQRIILWLDSVCQFYGVYERKGGEAQLRGETAQPTLR